VAREVVARRHHVVDLAPAVVDGGVEPLAVAGAPAVLGRDHHVPAPHEVAHLREVHQPEARVHAAVHEQDRRARGGRVARGEQVGGDRQPVGGRVRHLAHHRHPAERVLERRVDEALLLDLEAEVEGEERGIRRRLIGRGVVRPGRRRGRRGRVGVRSRAGRAGHEPRRGQGQRGGDGRGAGRRRRTRRRGPAHGQSAYG
jgi:hypothetical protein